MSYKNPADQRKNTNKWYARNREKHIEATARNKARYRAEWIEYKSNLKCIHCGAQHPAIIDFHHVIRKDAQKVYKLVANSAYKRAMREAEEKCIVLCANCHRILHYNEMLSRQAERLQNTEND